MSDVKAEGIPSPGVPTYEELDQLAARSRPRFREEDRPVFERALDGPDPVRRLAIQVLGLAAWYGGDTDEVERLWRIGVEEGRAAQDFRWLVALNNLSLFLSYQGRHFESLVLAGTVIRLADESEVGVRIFAGTCRARAFLELDLSRAETELARCRSWLPRVTNDPRTETSLLSIEIDHALALKRWDSAYELAQEQLGKLDPALPGPVHLTARYKSHRAEFHAFPSRREKILRELPRLSEGLEVPGTWGANWQRVVCLFRWEAAVARGDGTEAATCAREILEIGFNDLATRDLELSLELLEKETLESSITERFTALAADSILERFSLGQLDQYRVQELDEVDEADWRSMASYQASLLERAPILRQSFAERWKPGLPAYDQLVNRGGQVTQCAWCGRVQSGTEWRNGMDLGRLMALGVVSHGICPRCVENFRED